MPWKSYLCRLWLTNMHNIKFTSVFFFFYGWKFQINELYLSSLVLKVQFCTDCFKCHWFKSCPLRKEKKPVAFSLHRTLSSSAWTSSSWQPMSRDGGRATCLADRGRAWETCLNVLLFAKPFSNCSVTNTFIYSKCLIAFTTTLISPHGNICMSLTFGATHACYYANQHCSVLFLPDLGGGK